MGAPRGKGSGTGRRARAAEETGTQPPRGEAGSRVPDLLRRVVGMGVSGLFLGEEVVRKTIGDTLPRDWVDFAAAQSERTRRELIDRLAGEIGRALEGADLQQLAERLLRGNAIEVTARVRLVPQEPATRAGGRRRSLRVAIAEEEER